MSALQIASALALVVLIVSLAYRRVSDRLDVLEKESAERAEGMSAWMNVQMSSEVETDGDRYWVERQWP